MRDTRVARAFRCERSCRQLSVRAMAALLHISAPYLSDLENGRRRLSPQMADRIARLTHTKVADWQVYQIDDDIAALTRKRGEFAHAK